MGVYVCVNALKKISKGERELINAYNTLCEHGVDISGDLKLQIEEALGKKPDNGWREPIELGDDYIEMCVRGEGKAEYGDGMIILIQDLPVGTKALRVFMS